MIPLVVAAVHAGVLIGLVMGVVAYASLFERRLLARFQTRAGPERVGPQGLLQPIADGLKLFLKEDIEPAGADRWVWRLAPAVCLVPPFVGLAVIPLASRFAVADVSVGLLFVLAVGSLGVYPVILGGWGSNSKYALLGALRAGAQFLSYELALGLSLLSVVLLAGSLSLRDVVAAQAGLPFLLLQPVAFLVALVAAVAEANRSPFDLPEAETELVAGYFTEYSGMRFALFMTAEYVHIFLSAALLSTCFLGGWRGPLLPPPLWLGLKMGGFVLLFIWIRATLPRFRYDRLMAFGWKVLLPIAFLNLVLTGVVRCALS